MNKKFLDLGLQPLANEYLKKFNHKQKKYRLKIFFNYKNKLVSISKGYHLKKCLIILILIDLQCRKL